MGKAINEGAHGAAEFAQRTESNAFYLWFGIGHVENALVSASHELGICRPDFGPVFYRFLGVSAVRSFDERASSAYAVEVTWSS